MIEFSEKVCCSEVKVKVGRGVLGELDSIKGRKCVVHPKSLPLEVKGDLDITLEDGERGKDISNALSIVDKLLDAGFTRGDSLVAVGGGTVMDVAGFSASIFMRGLNLVNVPTTLLGMVDAGIGGKTGVNYGNAKNMIGTFYQPSLILDDLSFLDTLPEEELRRGLAEVIKYALVLDKELYDFLSLNSGAILRKDNDALERVISSSVKDKLAVVSEDERETKGIRIVLNFGHTIGHAIEAGSNFQVPHGLAISAGMVCEAKMAEELGYAEEGVVEDVLWLLHLFRLPISVEQLNSRVEVEKALSAMVKDKKRRGEEILMPFPTRIGNWRAVKIPLETLEGLAKQCLSNGGGP
ncbi:3-dehydroquinate synthase [Metallosphaera hakonensis]|uniref:3-dehydroquinate synthase n=1 Tax=Metallosphaera hakonensis JCM 8857 = DSM 7519 TaxID=1293036 RepID=A0A2U9IUZ9_9CREN|nr:3-dehydroquinate synthase [Metallosphaera hakonensis]AWR99834.1 3-dehydroquinate synthase [Metallosphaera hakonensis JCM 8857 = DSM 7519]